MTTKNFTSINFLPQILVISNLQTTSPVWVFASAHRLMNVILETQPENTIHQWTERSPDVVVFDVDIDETILLDLIRTLRAEADIPILLFVSSTKKESLLLAAYEAGIDEYMVKPISTSLFHAKINAWLRRASSLSIAMLDPLKVAGIQLDPSNRSLDIGEQGRIHLTILEVRLMYALMSTPGRTVSIDELCKQVWEKNRLGDATTLKNVVYRLRRKIEANPSNPKVIRTVVGVGYQFVSS